MYMKLTGHFRNLANNWKSNMVALAGLSLGMMVAILSVSYIIFESSYDSFHSSSERIYTVYTRINTSENEYATSFASESGLKDFALSHIPAVSEACRIKGLNTDIEVNENIFKDVDGYYCDPEFFRIFDFRLITGDEDVLSEPGKIILTRELSERLFGTIDSYNRIISINGDEYTVAGIAEDPPLNTNFNFSFLVSIMGTSASAQMDQRNQVNLYLLSSVKLDSAAVLKQGLDEYYTSAGRERYSNEVIQLSDLHQYGSKSSKSFLIFISISILVLFTSVVNYVNIQYARIETRTREIGMRKVNGASRWSIIGMIIWESLLMIFISSVLGLILSELFLDRFQQLTSVKVQQYGPGLWTIQVIVIVLTLFLGTVAGLLTSYRYSAFNPINLIRGVFRSGNKIYIRKIVIGLQFAISGGMAALMIIFYLQIDFLKNADMGFESDNRLLIELSPVMTGRYEMIHDEVLNIPGVDRVTGRLGGFGRVDIAMVAQKGENQPENRFFVMGYVVEDDFFNTYGIDIIEGKTFNGISGRDSNLVVIDKFTAGTLGLENPVGSKLKANGMTVEVIGVVDDADFIALNSERRPRFYNQFYKGCKELTVKYNGDPKAILSEIDKFLTGIDPEYVLNYKRLDESVAGLYQKETNLFRIIGICGIIAIALSLTGAYAMAAYLAERRMRQNSIRRVAGASEKDIIIKSILEIGWPVIAGTIVSWPFVYMVAGKWMGNFTEKVAVGILPFVLSFAGIAILVVLTIYTISRRAALRNPAELLRQE